MLAKELVVIKEKIVTNIILNVFMNSFIVDI